MVVSLWGSFPLLQPWIGSSYLLPSSKSRLLSSDLWMKGFFPPSFKCSRLLNSESISASRIVSHKYKVEGVCERVVVIYMPLCGQVTFRSWPWVLVAVAFGKFKSRTRGVKHRSTERKLNSSVRLGNSCGPFTIYLDLTMMGCVRFQTKFLRGKGPQNVTMDFKWESWQACSSVDKNRKLEYSLVSWETSQVALKPLGLCRNIQSSVNITSFNFWDIYYSLKNKI